MTRLLLLWLLLAAACCQAAPPTFTPVTPGRTLVFPADFGAHPEFRTEWWYVTGWLRTPDGKPLGFQVTFFRSRTGNDQANPSAFAAKQLIIGHAALSDPALGHLLHDERSAREGFGLAWARTGTTDVRLDDWTMVRAADGSYRVSVHARELAFDLRLEPGQPVLLQGERGFSQKGRAPRNASYYYSQPQLKVSGSASRRSGAAVAVTGTAWLDHEWSSEALQEDAAGWDWLGANLDDGSALMAFQIRAKRGGTLWAHATVRNAAGAVAQYAADQVRFTPQARWTSPRTGAVYPVATDLALGGTTWQLRPLQQDQELDSRRSTGAVYWEGAVNVLKDGVPAGHGYLEMTGYVAPLKL
ncbi:carotenoid 1,2-hydratase [Massilia solisilvae]|uniref:Carotenoid 1,2-hydratase n=1 Tax=Massilia solisilvae TaxID=1811225 RepID=A0ABT2BPB7_9BURK|nr:carotenoid 1,2-hydratase [Massilia solisilvae]